MKSLPAVLTARTGQERSKLRGIAAPPAAAVEEPLPAQLLPEAEAVLHRRRVPDGQLLAAPDPALRLRANFVSVRFLCQDHKRRGRDN